ncbi:helix-turn-helix transcriptional regulator [Lacipirellula sp.]|uniref:helix-turn-helix transcriptional regulator n=1 Tax=Lacipirellula sp. TaxID=2691419 RepID=UPI003D0F484C
MSAITDLSDRTIVDYLRRHPAATVGDMVEFTGVTATAVRQRLVRLMEQGLLAREAEVVGRGRPTHRYSLTPAGVRSGANNYDQLVQVLWNEIREIRDIEVRRGLLKRISERLAETYRNEVHGETLQERMADLARLMASQDMPFELQELEQLPVLTALACPYPDLAEQDRGICAMEKMLLSSVLGESVRLSSCRLDGANCCTFEASGAAG